MSRNRKGCFVSPGCLIAGRGRPLSVLVLFLGLVTGCTHLGNLGQGLPPEEAVGLRAQAWGDALIRRDVGAAYAFTTPNYRDYASLDQYALRVQGSMRWSAVELDSVQCDEEICEASMVVEYQIRRYGIKNRRTVQYKWLEANGQWWLYVAPN